MEKLCKDLTSTYDTNILDNEDKTVQDEFLNVSRKNRKNKGFHDIEHTGDLREDILNKIPKTPKYCLDMRKIKQPFFSYSNLPTRDEK